MSRRRTRPPCPPSHKHRSPVPAPQAPYIQKPRMCVCLCVCVKERERRSYSQKGGNDRKSCHMLDTDRLGAIQVHLSLQISELRAGDGHSGGARIHDRISLALQSTLPSHPRCSLETLSVFVKSSLLMCADSPFFTTTLSNTFPVLRSECSLAHFSNTIPAGKKKKKIYSGITHSIS